MILFIGVLALNLVAADAATGDDIQNQLKAAAEQGAGYNVPQDPRLTAALIIRSLLSFLGLVMVGLFLYAGFLWMTAGGNSDSVDKAKGLIKNAVIGMIIIISAYSLTYLLTYFALGGKRNILDGQVQTFEPFE